MNSSSPVTPVCVVMPLYDKRDFVLRAVMSVLGQTMRDFELIVVDDGSTDGSGDLVRQLCDPRLRLLRTENHGPGAARNCGARSSNAPWIALLDADDEWQPGFLELTLAAARIAPATAAVFTDVVARNAVPEARAIGSGPIENYFAARMHYGIAVSCSSILIRRSAYERCGGFREDYRYAEDIETWLRLSGTGPFYFVAEPLCLIEVGSAARLTRSIDYRERAAGLQRLHESFEAQLRAGAIPAAQLAGCYRFFQQQRAQQALHLARCGERLAALRLLGQVPLGSHTWREYARVLWQML